MKHIILITLVTLSLWAAQEKGKRKSPQREPQSTLTGCLDQRGERYVLSSGADMTKLTTLTGKGFSNDNFARYIGRKVAVKGAQNGDTFEVVKIDTVSETCSR